MTPRADRSETLLNRLPRLEARTMRIPVREISPDLLRSRMAPHHLEGLRDPLLLEGSGYSFTLLMWARGCVASWRRSMSRASRWSSWAMLG